MNIIRIILKIVCIISMQGIVHSGYAIDPEDMSATKGVYRSQSCQCGTGCGCTPSGKASACECVDCKCGQSPAESSIISSVARDNAGFENPFVGSWHYRSLHNIPGDENDWNKLHFGEAAIVINQTEFGQIAGTLGGEGWSLNIKGQTTFGNPYQIRFQGTGIVDSELWIYDYEGFLAPRWVNGVNQTSSIIGTIVRTKEHSQGKSPAGYTASWYAVKLLEAPMPSLRLPSATSRMKIPPKEVIDLMASRPHRLHHFVWHQVRNSWHRYPQDTRDAIIRLGWVPGGDAASPRHAYYEGTPRPKGKLGDGVIAVDNYSGEDFLYMHRQMIGQVNELLKRHGGEEYPKIEGWKHLPDSSDSDFPIPPDWPDSEIADRKSPEYFKNTMQPWESYYLAPETLRRLTLGQLGSLIECTIHNQLHNRWSAQPNVVRPDPKDTDPEGIPKGPWDEPSYNYLGDTYSSHVNPIFWYIHGWVDSCIDLWQEANGLSNIDWKGTWVGHFPEGVHAANFLSVMDQDHPGHDHHLEELIKVVKLIGKCGIFSEYRKL